MDKSDLISFVIRKYNGSNNSLFLNCQMGLSDGAFFMIKHTPLPNGNHPIWSPIFPMGVADALGQSSVFLSGIHTLQTQTLYSLQGTPCMSILTGKTLFSLKGTPVLIAGSLFSLQDFPCISLYFPVRDCSVFLSTCFYINSL